MHCLLNVVLLFWITIFKLTVGLIDIQSTHDDLRGKEVCMRDTCSYPLNGTNLYVGCHCDENCARIGTCCLDSRYIQIPRPKLKPACRLSHGTGQQYFMVDRCPTNDSVYESLCRAYNFDENDFLTVVPVTSLLTFITYRNYFCFRCHETNDEFVYWKVKLSRFLYDGEINSMSSEDMQSDFEKQMFSVAYTNGYWRASFRNASTSFFLALSVEVPQEIKPLARLCVGMIEGCATNWTDSKISEKCQAYMGVREVKKLVYSHYFPNGVYDIKIYKNMHCALCNFEDLSNITCEISKDFEDHDPSGKIVFSFSHLLDINNADGDKVGKIEKCDDDHIWDRFAGTCRKLTCAFPGYKIKNGKCQP